MNSSQSFAPFNDDIDTNPDRDFIRGPYSTYDVKLSRVAHATPVDKWPRLHYLMGRLKLYDADTSRKKAIIHAALWNMRVEKVLQYHTDIADIFWDCIRRDDIRQRVVKFKRLDFQERFDLFQDMIDAMTIAVNQRGATIPKISVDYDTGIRCLAASWESDNPNSATIRIPPNMNWKRIDSICACLIHEFKHIMDIFSPNQTPLGAQLMSVAIKNYIYPWISYFGYADNPTEINANVGMDSIAQMVRQIKNTPSRAHRVYD